MTPSFVIYNMYSEMSPGIDMYVTNLQKFAVMGNDHCLFFCCLGIEHKKNTHSMLHAFLRNYRTSECLTLSVEQTII